MKNDPMFNDNGYVLTRNIEAQLGMSYHNLTKAHIEFASKTQGDITRMGK